MPSSSDNIFARPGPDSLLLHMLQTALSAQSGYTPEVAQQKMADMIRGVQKYQAAPVAPMLRQHPVIWEQGAVRLMRLAGGGADLPPLILIPSLINGWEILDLLPGQSFAAYLKQAGFDVYICDWGDLRDDPEVKTIADLLHKRLVPLIEMTARIAARRVSLAGYCMGGLLMAGALPRVMPHVAGCLYLAAPWDFHAEDPLLTRLVRNWVPQIWPTLQITDFLPNAQIQALFALVDPEMAMKKYARFAAMAASDPLTSIFVATEDWLRTGRDLPRDMAAECIRDWYLGNLTGSGRWQMGGQGITPALLSLVPSMVVAPRRDRVVETAVARALYTAMGPENASYLEPDIGHIGMMASPKAQAAVWEPVAAWLSTLTTRAAQHK